MGIVAAVIVDVVILSAFTMGPILPPPANPPTSCTGESGLMVLGEALGVEAPLEWSDGAHHWDNFTVATAECGIALQNIEFQVVTATGGIITPASNWSMVAIAADGPVLGTYSVASGQWLSGGATEIASSQEFVLDTATTSLSDQGDGLNVIGTGAFQGSISVYLP